MVSKAPSIWGGKATKANRLAPAFFTVLAMFSILGTDLVTRSLDPTGRGQVAWVARWKPALNAFAIAFDGRINPAENN